MNIGIFVSPRHSVPSKDDQRSVSWDTAAYLTDGLVGTPGNTVTLFASRGSKTKAELVHFDMDPVDHYRGNLSTADYRGRVAQIEVSMFEKALTECTNRHIDILHVHDPVESLLESIIRVNPSFPILFTLHDAVFGDRVDALTKLAALPNVHFVAVSKAQKGSLTFPFADTIYDGIDIDCFPFTDKPDSYLMAAGRVAPERGIDEAITAARRANTNLIVAGKIFLNLMGTNSYYHEKIEPFINDSSVVMKQFLSRPDLRFLFGKAYGFLYPMKWDEPFGLVLVEALAAGVPVIAYNRGFVSEAVVDGTTGFIIDPDNGDRQGKGTWKIKKTGVDGMVEAIGQIKNIQRTVCRAYAKEHFSVDAIVTAYLSLYAKLVHKQ